VSIPVTTVQNVLKLPNTALRYKPPMAPEEILALYKRYGIEGDEKQRTGDEHSSSANSGTQNLPRAPRAENAVVWKLHADNTVEPVKVSLGITDHSYTEVTALMRGELREGDELIIRSVMPKTQTPGGAGIRR